MKKMLFAALLATCAMCAVSCGGAGNGIDGNENGSVPEADEIVSAEFSISYKVSGDVLDIADVSVEYTDALGEQHSETLSSGNWSFKAVAVEFPATVSFRPVYSLKENAGQDKESYKLGTEYEVAITRTFESGKDNTYSTGSPDTITVTADKLDDWVTRMNARAARTYTVASDGTVSQGTSSSEAGE